MRVTTAIPLLLPLLFTHPVGADETASAKPADSPSAATGAAVPANGPRIEVAFVLDATGSMSPYIEEARRRITEIAADLATGEPRPAVRYALVGYRDRGDAFVTRVHPFAGDVAVMHRHLAATKADGGGDHPEAVLEGLHAAITKLPWSDGDPEVLKLIYLIGDAPPQHYDDTPDERAVAEAARRRGIVIHTIACGNMNSLGLTAFDELARLTEGRAFELREAGSHLARGGSHGGGTSFAAAVSGSAQAYSASVGVAYDRERATELATSALPAAALRRSGLLGAHVRWIRDPIAWSDAWAAHTSALPAADRPALPEVDFATHHVLVVGGDGAGLAVDAVTTADGRRAANIRPGAGGGVQFVLVPAGASGDEGETR